MSASLQRILFKLGLIVCKTVNSDQPQYSKSVHIPQTYHYSMRLSDHLCLVSGHTKFKNCSLQTSFFSCWTYFLELSSRPVGLSVRCASSLVSFGSRLKTYIFQIAY